VRLGKGIAPNTKSVTLWLSCGSLQGLANPPLDFQTIIDQNCTMSRRAKQAGFIALNVRLPPNLHKSLRQAAGTTRSLNAEILDRLQRSFEPDTHKENWLAKFEAWRTEFVASLERRTKEDLEQFAERRNQRAEEELRRITERIDQLEAGLPGRHRSPRKRSAKTRS